MSLDALFHQIRLTEQQFAEQTRRLKEVKVVIIQCQGKIKSASEKYKRTREELDEKAQRAAAIRLWRDVAKKCEEQMLRQIEELLSQRSRQREQLAEMKMTSQEEEERFLEEVSKFNSDFSLCGSREAVLEREAHAGLLDLHREEQALLQEMALMSQTNAHLSSMEAEKRGVLQELQRLDSTQKDLERQLSDSKAATRSLRSQVLVVSRRPLTDHTCLRLKKELEELKEGDLQEERDSLSMEIQLLQSKLDSSQTSGQH